jgi:hypothetical protein
MWGTAAGALVLLQRSVPNDIANGVGELQSTNSNNYTFQGGYAGANETADGINETRKTNKLFLLNNKIYDSVNLTSKITSALENIPDNVLFQKSEYLNIPISSNPPSNGVLQLFYKSKLLFIFKTTNNSQTIIQRQYLKLKKGTITVTITQDYFNLNLSSGSNIRVNGVLQGIYFINVLENHTNGKPFNFYELNFDSGIFTINSTGTNVTNTLFTYT